MVSCPAVSVKPLPGSDLVFAGVARYQLGYAGQTHVVVIERLPSGEYGWSHEAKEGVAVDVHSGPGKALVAAMNTVVNSMAVTDQTVQVACESRTTKQVATSQPKPVAA